MTPFDEKKGCMNSLAFIDSCFSRANAAAHCLSANGAQVIGLQACSVRSKHDGMPSSCAPRWLQQWWFSNAG